MKQIFTGPVQCIPVTEAAYDSLIEIWETSVRATHHFLKEADIVFFRPLIRHNYFKQVKLTGLLDNKRQYCGFAGTSGSHLEMLFLHPAATGKGWGRFLLQYVIAADGTRYVDVNEQNDNALQFYLRMGFEIAGRSPVDGLGKPYPLLHLQLKNIG